MTDVFHEVDAVYRLEQEKLRCPVTAFDGLRAAGPVVWLESQKVFAVTGYHEAQTVLDDAVNFSSANMAGEQATRNYAEMLSRAAALARDAGRTGGTAPLGDAHPLVLAHADPPVHTRQRALVRPSFSAARVRRAESRIAELADGLLDKVVERGRMDVRAEYSDALMSQIVTTELHCPVSDAPTLQRWARIFMRAVGRDLTDAELDEMARARFEFDEYFDHRIDEVRGQPVEDMLGAIVNERVAEDEEPLTRGELLMICELLLQGGTETSGNTTTNIVHFLAGHPSEADRLRADPGAIPAFIDEYMRWDQPDQMLHRTAVNDTEVAGTLIPTGSVVMVHKAAASRDPRVYDHPGELDYSRPPQRSLVFGGGPHFCLGAALGKAQIRIALERLLARATDIELAVDESELRKIPSIVLHGFEQLPVRFRTIA
ncbi:cytochrome P450 [Pseudonocardia ailaonensis]|uniref:cytochrome P450 n=1 Tax=Pseudonocardia ailaonensis TaxID=367279 RepID=UPI0031D3BD3B